MGCFKRFRLLILGGLGLLVLAGGVLAGRRSMPWIRERAVGLVVELLPGEISYSQLHGNPLTGLHLTDLSVRLETGDSIRVARLSVHYNLFSLLGGLILGRGVELRRGEVLAPQVYLAVERPQGLGEAARFPNLEIRSLRIADGRVWVGKEERAAELTAQLHVSSRPEELRIKLEELKADLVKEGIGLKRFVGEATIANGRWILKDMALVTSGSSLKFSAAVVGPGEWWVAIAECRLDLAEFLKGYGVAGALEMKGRALLKGREGSGEVEFWTGEGMVKGVALPPLEGTLHIAGSRLAVKARTRGEGLSIDLAMDMGSGRYDVEARFCRFSPEGVPVELRLNGRIGLKGMLDQPRYELKGQLSQSELEGVVLDQLMIEVEIQDGRGIGAIEATLGGGRVRLNGEVAPAQFEICYDLSDLALARFSGLIKAPVEGIIDGKGRVSGGPDSVDLSGDIKVKGLELGGLKVGSISSELKFKELFKLDGEALLTAHKVEVGSQSIRSVRLCLDDGRFQVEAFQDEANHLAAWGEFEVGPAQDFTCQITHFEVVARGDSLRTSEVRVVGRGGEYWIGCEGFSLAGGMGRLDLHFGRGGPPRLSGELTNLDLERVGRLLGRPGLSGLLDLKVSALGPAEHRVKVWATGFKSGPIAIKAAWGEFEVGLDQVSIEELSWVYAEDTSRISGRLDYHRRGFKVDLKGFDLAGRFEDPGPWVFGFLTGIVDLRAGRISGEVSLKGSFKEPVWAGQVSIQDGVVFIPSVKVLAQEAQLELQFKGNRLVLSQARSRVTDGELLGTGVAAFSGFTPEWVRYRFRYRMIPIHPMEGVYGVTDGDLELGWARGQPLSLEGEVRVVEAVVNLSLGATPVGPGGGSGGVEYRLRLRGDRGIWLRNPDFDIELAGDLEVLSLGGEFYLEGSLETRQGKVYYLDHTLHLTRGRLFFPRAPRLDPELDIWAELDTRRFADRDPKRPIKIVLHLSGTLSQPKFRFFSQPPVLSEEDIISYLTLNRTWQELTAAETQDLFYEVISEKLLSYFQRELSERIEGFAPLDYFRLDAGPLSDSPMRATFGKYISPDLYLSYTHNLMEHSEDLFRAEYSLGRHHQILGEKTEAGDYRLQYRWRLRY